MLAYLLFIISFNYFILSKAILRCNFRKINTISVECLTSIRNGRTYYFCFNNEPKVCVSHPMNLDLCCCTTNFDDPIRDLENHVSKLPVRSTIRPWIIPTTTPTIDIIDRRTTRRRGCYDTLRTCYLYTNLCYKTVYGEIMDTNCRKTCGYCK
uniref:ShKT domain-containing protein n=1 Tax=Parastrongyloides trichosuri TaxID=131310 RepID=A0A0N4ZKI4_PARTI